MTSANGRRRILQLVPNSTANVYYQAFSDYLPRDRYHIEYLSFDPPGRLHEHLRAAGIEAWSLRTGTATVSAGKAFAQLLSVFSSRRYDLVHLHGFCSLAAGLPAARCMRIPRVVYNHYYGGELLLYRRNWPSRTIDRTFSPRVDHVIAVSRDLEQYLLEGLRIPQRKISLIPFGLDFPGARLSPEERAAKRAALGMGDDFVIGCVARLHWTKGHRYLLEALSRVRTVGGRRIRAIFLGEGRELGALKAHARHLGLGESVQFLGLRPDVWSWYQLMDLLVHPSLLRAYELVVAEAMGAGTPVLSSTVGIAKEIIVHGRNGWLVPERDAEAIAAVLRGLDPVSLPAIGAAGRDTVTQRVGSRQAMVESYLRLYESLLG